MEELPAYRLLLRAILAHTLAQQGRLLLHAAAIGERGRAWLFPGPNGAGKSTLARQARGTPLADDAVVVFLEDGQPFAEGTPFVSDDGPSPHTGIVPIAGVLTLKKGMRTRLHPIGRRSLVRTMLEQLFLPPGQSEPTVSQLRTLLQTATSVVTGELEFTRSTRFCAADLGIPPVPCAVGA
ncbi:MAG: hypothetical protein D6729_10100 [Deltaproteobacteria bacterium]|nr:MAG: hypothetical protein D6729_10100 [Deltaproteobacteria bacterium]